MRCLFSRWWKAQHRAARFVVRARAGAVCLGLIATLLLSSTAVTRAIIPQPRDFGDAPLPYPTILNNGAAWHQINPTVFLGAAIDAENDGQPTATALGDDFNPTVGPDDEDGVIFASALVPGQPALIQVIASARGFLNAWIDYDGNMSWAEAGEQIAVNVSVTVGTNDVVINVPSGVKEGVTYARFRYNLQGGVEFGGGALDGEVEDYRVSIGQPADFGDAPQGYPTLLANNGARHTILQGFHLGELVDPEPDGQPGASANFDDANPAGGPDDEDGVIFVSDFQPGADTTVEVLVSGDGFLNVWVDFNNNSSWAEAMDHALTDEPVVAGLNIVKFPVPSGSAAGNSFARFRLSREPGISFDGPVPDGEVEDYSIRIEAAFDFGDAPATYPTLLANNGARHVVVPGYHLGSTIDQEGDGQPSGAADGDDVNPTGGTDDEDGVQFATNPLVPGTVASVLVEASEDGRLDAWVDFNANGSWADAGEQIFTDVALVIGINTLTFPVPAGAVNTAGTFARFRYSQNGKLNFNGPSQDGEVEDYRIGIAGALDYGDAPDSYQTTSANDGARHTRLQGVHLGALIDIEADGQPSTIALGDDNNPSPSIDDEDGVEFASVIAPGQMASVTVVASSPGQLDAWMDFGRDGSFAESGDQIFSGVPLTVGINSLTFPVPSAAVLGRTYARFRLSREGGLKFFGPAQDGEVEDYIVSIETPQPPCEGSSKGTDFWLTFPANYAPDPDNPLRLSLCIVGMRDTAGTVEIPGLGFSQNFVIPGSMEVVVNLPKAADLGDAIDVVESKGIHVTADGPIAVFGHSRVFYTSDGYLGIPSAFLGKEYIIQSYQNVHSGVPSLNGSQFALVACEDDTRVTIVPSFDVAGHPASMPFEVLMHKGDTYQLRGTNDAPADLSGTIVLADKPVGAFGSHRCANIPDENTWFCDYIVEHLLPTERAGRSFVTYPLATRVKGDTFRAFPIQDGTIVFTNSIVAGVANRGGFVQFELAKGARVTTEFPILLTQYSNSSDHDGVTDSDPFELVVPSVNLYLNQYMICVPDAGFVSHYINITALSSSVGLILLDGMVIPPILFSPIGASGFSGAQVPVTPGAHNVTSVGGASGIPLPFGLSVYGWAEYDSYGYPGGFFFTDKVPPRVTCLVSNVVVPADAQCQGRVPDLRQYVTFSDNCERSPNTVVDQEPKIGTSVPAGTHPVSILVTDANGNTGSCTIDLIVTDDSPPMLDCPTKPVVANCENDEGAKVEFTVTASTACGVPATVECNPPSGSFFPLGETLVTCTATSASGQTSTCEFFVSVRCLKIEFTPTPNTVMISWSGGGTLQRSDKLEEGWVDDPTARSPLVIDASNQTQFFQIRYDD